MLSAVKAFPLALLLCKIWICFTGKASRSWGCGEGAVDERRGAAQSDSLGFTIRAQTNTFCYAMRKDTIRHSVHTGSTAV